MLRYLSVLVALFFATQPGVFAQPYQKFYSITDLNVNNRESKLLSDNNLLTVGSIGHDVLHNSLNITKTNTTTGAVIWSKSYRPATNNLSGITCDELDNGNIVVGATMTDTTTLSRKFPVVLCFSGAGDLLWSKCYNYTTSYPYTEANKVKSLPGNNFLACFHALDTFGLSIIKMNNSGDTLFYRTLQLDFTQGVPTSITDIIPVNNGYLFSGLAEYDADFVSQLLIKTDTNGNVIWLKSDYLNFTTHYLHPIFSKMRLLPDSTILIGISNYGTQLLKVNTSGTPISLINITDTPSISEIDLENFTVAPDGNYLITGITDAFTNSFTHYRTGKQCIYKTDTAGHVLWAKRYKAHRNKNESNLIAVMPGGDILTAGTCYDSTFYGANEYSGNFIMRTDTGGESAGTGCGLQSDISLFTSSGTVAFFDKPYHVYTGYGFHDQAVLPQTYDLQTNELGTSMDVFISNWPSFLCEGSTSVITASAINGGTNPTYTFLANGVVVQSGPSTTYSTTTLHNGDTVRCILQSTDTCTSPAIAYSNPIVMPIWPLVDATVTISASPGTMVPAGTLITFTATLTNGGPTPHYAWKKNGTAVGLIAPTYSSASLVTGDIITCQVTTSVCTANPTVVSNADTIVIAPVGIAALHLDDAAIQPNPANGTCTVLLPFSTTGTIAVTDLMGKNILAQQVTGDTYSFDVSGMPNGIYIIRLSNDNNSWQGRLVVSH